MNKLLANRGGQPLHLEDLQLMQDNTFTLMASMVKAMAGNHQTPLLLAPLRMNTIISPDATPDDKGYKTTEGVSTTIAAGAVIHEGNIIPFDEKTFSNLSLVSQEGIWVVIQTVKTDNRILKNGYTTPCRLEYKAHLQEGKPVGTTAAYPLFDLETIDEVLARRIGIDTPDTRYRQMPVVFYNGFTGSVRYSDRAKLLLKIDVRSSNTGWEPDNSDYADTGQFLGLIGIMIGDRATRFGTMITPELSISLPLRPDGKPFGGTDEQGTNEDAGYQFFKSFVETTGPRMKIVIHNIGRYYDTNEAKWINVSCRGHLPPCMEGDEYGQIQATMEYGKNDQFV